MKTYENFQEFLALKREFALKKNLNWDEYHALNLRKWKRIYEETKRAEEHALLEASVRKANGQKNFTVFSAKTVKKNGISSYTVGNSIGAGYFDSILEARTAVKDNLQKQIDKQKRKFKTRIFAFKDLKSNVSEIWRLEFSKVDKGVVWNRVSVTLEGTYSNVKRGYSNTINAIESGQKNFARVKNEEKKVNTKPTRTIKIAGLAV